VDADAIAALLVEQLRLEPGVTAIVLGGSRARGSHTAQSDIDIALYYRPDYPPDLTRLGQIATAVDDAHRPDLLTDIGGWGPWINGGGWLTVRELPVDLLYRDLRTVTEIVQECREGRPLMVYQPGHPHGFNTSIYLAEIALCRVLWDPDAAIEALKRLAVPYPAALRSALIRQFFWEADFALKGARKAIARRDVSYIAGCCFRCISSLMQTLFALNERYWMNEKGAVAIAAAFDETPECLSARVDAAFARLAPDEAQLTRAIEELEQLVLDTARLPALAAFTI